MLPVAVDGMGGDFAPREVVLGARRAAEELGVPVVLVGRPDALGDTGDVEVVAASEVIAMDEDPAGGVRRKKDSSLVRAAELVRDGRASAMVSAGNTGAAMASALLRMGRMKGLARPAVAAALPSPIATPTILLDAGANAEVQPEWLVQFALMGAVVARARLGVATPKVGLLTIGEESSKGTPTVKAAHELLAAGIPGATFVGNVEGRDLLTEAVDVVVADGFTGNVALKSMEGALRAVTDAFLGAFDASDATRSAAEVLRPALEPLRRSLDPEEAGGALLAGVEGVCVISHGSSSARAIVNAVRMATELVEAGVVDQLRGALAGS